MDHQTEMPSINIYRSDARDIPIPKNSADLIVTSPPYWQKRDYGFEGQVGQEPFPDEYADVIAECASNWFWHLKDTGSIFLNLGDTYEDKSLVNIPGRVEDALRRDGWLVRNRIVWAKEQGMPNPAKDRLANRHEVILHVTQSGDYHYDQFAYEHAYDANLGDVWTMNPDRNTGSHLAPFPEELVERAITAACPKKACSRCGEPYKRKVQRTTELDESRPQARRAVEIAEEEGLTDDHIRAIQAVGISDAGKAARFQDGTGRNADEAMRLAEEAKEALGGYFREFTFAKRETVGWEACECAAYPEPGVVLDPFVGSGTTLEVAARMGRSAVGVDLDPPNPDGLEVEE